MTTEQKARRYAELTLSHYAIRSAAIRAAQELRDLGFVVRIRPCAARFGFTVGAPDLATASRQMRGETK